MDRRDFLQAGLRFHRVMISHIVGEGELNCRFIVALTSEHCSGWRSEQRRPRRMISSAANVNKRWRPVALLRAGRQIPHIPPSEIKDARYVWQSSGRFSWIEGMRCCVCVCVCLPFSTSSSLIQSFYLLCSLLLSSTLCWKLQESQFLIGFYWCELVIILSRWLISWWSWFRAGRPSWSDWLKLVDHFGPV